MTIFNDQKNHNLMYPSFLPLLQTSLLLTFLVMIFSTDVYSQRFELVWSDEFEEQQLNNDTWNPWEGTAYNNEDQYYTPWEDNIYQEDGFLHLVGLRENYGGKQWTSGRINTQNNFEFQHGKVEIRAKLPAGKGLWPAFWMLGSNIDDSGIGWPYSGEIDIMEYRGHLTSQTTGTIHFSAVEPGFPRTPNSDRRSIGHEYDLPEGSFADDFHLFQFQWSDSLMIWSIDDVEFFRLTRDEIEERTSYYPFDQPFYLILNLAIGGDFLGNQQPDENTPDRNEVIVDYVRVYQDVNKEPNIDTGYGTEEHIKPNQNVTIQANITDEDGSIERVEFHVNDEIIATITSTPYQVEWRPGIDGCYELMIKAYDNDNGVGRNNPTTFVAGTGCTKRFYLDDPQTFPGTLQFEYYDYGGLGESYYESTPDTNLGNGLGNNFRTTEAVDIIPDENEDDNYLILDAVTGEWLTYQLEVEQSGIYDIELRFIPGDQAGRLSFSLDDEDWIYFTRLASQGDEYYSTKTTSGVELHKGTYELKMDIAIGADGFKPDHLKAVLKETITSYEHIETSLPSSIQLSQNFPNPFNPTTNITFKLDRPQNSTLEIFNSLGQHIETLYSGRLPTGDHSFTFDASGLSSGVYYYQLSGNNTILTRKMLLMK